MSSASTLRRAVAWVRTGAECPAWATIGNRPIYQFWQLLSPHFRDVLLPPQRRSDGGGFSWSWREQPGGGPPTAAELADLRQRLKTAERALSAATPEPAWQQDPDDAGGSGGLEDKVKAGAQAMAARFAAMPDPTLAGFVCRTESGPMVHSWGATAPATPCFVDAIECEIGGTVLVGDESGAGLELVLENRAGATLAQTRTDAAGAFLFRKIPGGDYRIRVEHRGDFPTTGYSVSIEQDSIYGLELRRGAAVATISRGSSRAPFASPPPGEGASDPPVSSSRRSRRPLLIGALVLALGGGAGLGWYFFDGPARGGATGPAGVPWQTAGGVPVVAPAAEAAAAGPGGTGAGSSGSSVSRQTGERSGAGRVGRNHDRVPVPEASAAAAKPGAGAEIADGGNRLSAATGREAEAGEPTASKPGLRAATQAEVGGTVEADLSGGPETPPATTGASTGKRRVAATKRDGAGETPTSVAASKAFPDAVEAGSATMANADVAIEKVAATADGSSRNPARPAASGRPGRGGADGSSGPEAVGGEGAARVGPAAESGGAGKAAGGAGTTSRGGRGRSGATGSAGRAGSGTAKPAGGEGAAPAGADVEEAAAGGQARGGPATPSARPNVPAKRDGAPAETSERPVDGDSSGAAATATEVRGSPRPASAVRATEARPARVAPRSGATANPPIGSGPATAEKEADATATARPPPVGTAARAATDRGAASDTRSGNDEPPAARSATGVVVPATDDGGRPQRHRVALAGGGLRLWRDAVLPTQPTPIGRAEPIELLQRRLREERETRIPAGFRSPVTARGVVLDVPASALPAGGTLRWRDAAGAEPAGSSVQGARAELAWGGERGAAAGEWRLVRPDGGELAHVALEPGGLVTVRAIPAVRSAIWVAVEGVGAATAWEWRMQNGGAVAEAWPRADRWTGGQGARLEVPLGTDGGLLEPVALVDPESGWAVTFDVGRR